MVELGVDLQVYICCANALDQMSAAIDGYELVLLAVNVAILFYLWKRRNEFRLEKAGAA